MNSGTATTNTTAASGELARLRRFTGKPNEFWPAFLAAAGELIGANRGVLAAQSNANGEAWRKLSEWSQSAHTDRSAHHFSRVLSELAERCIKEGPVLHLLEVAAIPETRNFAVAVRLDLLRPEDVCAGIFLLLNVTEDQAKEAILRLQLLADTPASYQQSHLNHQARADVEKFASTLDLMVDVNNEKRFLAASLAFCNGIATKFGCERVSLGWLQGGYIRLRTISRTEKFDRKMAAVKALEVAMEEALDQDDEVLWPAPKDSTVIARDHEGFCREQTVANICSLPLRVEKKPVAVLTCERNGRPFTELEVQQFRLACDQAARRLHDLKRQDRWFGARLATFSKETLGKVVGPEHTWAKVLSLVGVAALVLLLLPIWNYRVEGNFILRSDDVMFISTPFDGYLGSVAVRPGDLVKKGDELLRLNTVDLELEEAAAMADLNRYEREAEKARAANSLAEMRIAHALGQQVEARLGLIRYRLSQAVIRSPFDGVLVEGDLRQRIGAPVKQGDNLFRIARTDALYVEAELNERDVHEVLSRKTGEVAFVSQPKLKFPIQVERIEPVAVSKAEANVFVLRAKFNEAPADWWRPGMSGLCKLDVEPRTLLWIISHRTVDFIRLWLWW